MSTSSSSGWRGSGVRHKLLAVGAAVLLGVLVCDRIVAWGCDWIVVNSSTKFARLYRGHLAYDILLLGNSRGAMSFCPADIQNATGQTVFQLSHKGMSLEIAAVLVEDYARRSASPRLIVLEGSCIDDSSHLIHDLKAYGTWSEGLAAIARATSPRLWAASRVLRTLQFNNGEILLRSLWCWRHSDQEVSSQNTRVIDPRMLAEIPNLSPDPRQGDPYERNARALSRLLAVCRDRGIEIRVVFMPFVRPTAEGDDRIDTLAREQGLGSIVHDYSQMALPQDCFSDYAHLNYAGSRAMLDRMLSDGVFKTSRPADKTTASPATGGGGG